MPTADAGKIDGNDLSRMGRSEGNVLQPRSPVMARFPALLNLPKKP